MKSINCIKSAFKDAWKLTYDNMLDCSDRCFKGKPRMKFEEATIWTQLLATAMALSILFVAIIIPIYLLCKYAFGIELGFMWFLDWHIAIFCIVLGFIGYFAKSPIFIFIALCILGYSVYIQNENSPYGTRTGESVFLEFITLGQSSSYASITIGESFCAFREYQGNTCKNYIHYKMNKEYAKAKKILKEKELEATKQWEKEREKEIKNNTLSNRLGNIIDSYKGGGNE